MRNSARLLVLALVLLLAAPAALGQEQGDIGGALVDVAQQAIEPGNVSTTLSLLFLLTVLSLAPAILVMTTAFTRIIVVLGFLRQAMATQQTPPNQVLIGLALFLTFYIMAPTFEAVNNDAIAPYRAGQITAEEAVEKTLGPIRQFMFRQARAEDIALFLEIARLERPNTPADVPTHVLINAFVLSELRTAFQIGFVLYIPFLIIDMVVASTLMSMGMMMLPPVFVSLPFKIIMFVLADGWRLIVESLVRSFQ